MKNSIIKLFAAVTIIFVLLAAFALFTSLVSFTQQQPDHSLARVNRVQGYYIFIQSQPVHDVEILGTVKKTGVTWSGSPDEMFETLIRRTKKDFPRADAIIFDDVELKRATCVRFK